MATKKLLPTAHSILARAAKNATPQYYRFRGCSCVGATHYISGGFQQPGAVGGGILEWCFSQADAQAVLEKMLEYPHQFSRLKIEKVGE